VRILIVDDEPTIRFSLAELLGADGHDVEEAEHAPAALARLEDAPADLVITDLRMPAMDGLELLAEVRSRHPDTLVVLLTAHGDERMAVTALRSGAYGYIPKPFDNDEVRSIVARAREVLALRADNRRLRGELAAGFGGLIGGSEAMRAVYRVLERAGPADVSVLITGESGTGKELAARALHDAGRRRTRPFVALNCSALPADLVESELFGHVRGAFTGADRDRAGLFEAAGGGTLFLDEIGDLAPAAQAKLLRALETREITRVGANRAVAVDVRVIAATNRPLDELVAAGGFREDLLYRLQVLTLRMPPLRDRRDDILPLAVHFAAGFGERHGRRVRDFDEDARRALLAHDWPGNVRELRNAIERAVVMAESDVISRADLPATVAGAGAPLRPAEAATAGLTYAEARDHALRAFERDFIAAALERHGGNVSRTADALGMHRQSLQKVMRRCGLAGS
jgi:DNA-binding NtrC family response regulator